jgi:glycine hydroxymethyltransferase
MPRAIPASATTAAASIVDVAETLAIERAKQLFGCGFANVQPNSGSQMNQAVFLALLNPGDTFMGLDLNSGGHLTHGSPVNMSGKWFNVVAYGVRATTSGSTWTRSPPRARAQAQADHRRRHGLFAHLGLRAVPRDRRRVGAYLMVDMAHFAGLVAGGAHPSPLPHAHVVTTTTHKSLRGPRGGMILWNDEALAKKINIGGLPRPAGRPADARDRRQGGGLRRGAAPEFKAYAQIVANAKALAAS